MKLIKHFIFRDKQKEKSRQEKLRKYEETGKWPGFKEAKANTREAWSDKKDQQRRKQDRRAKKDLKRKRTESKPQPEPEKDPESDGDDDLDDDYKLLKKIKRGKRSEDEFDKKISLDDVQSEEEES